MTIRIGDKEYCLDGYVTEIQKVIFDSYHQGLADGIAKGRADAIDEFSKWLFKKEYITTDNWEMWHLDREDIVKEFLVDELKQEHFANTDKMIDEQKCVSVDDCHKHCKNDNYLCNECHKIFNDCFESNNQYQE